MSLFSLFRKHIELITIVTAYLIGYSYLATIKPFWFDELFTLYIVETASISKILNLLGPMDPHPPVHYLMVLLSHTLFGISELSTRLPALIMLAITMVGSYAIVNKYLNKHSALFCVLLIISSVSLRYSYEARPYSSILAFTTLTYWFWINAKESGKWLYIILCGISCSVTVLTHFYAVLGLIPIFISQLISLIRDGKSTLKLNISIGLGTSMLLLAIPTLQSITVLSKDNWAAPSLYDFAAATTHFYWFMAIVIFVSLWDAKKAYKAIIELISQKTILLTVISLASLIIYGFLFSLISGAFHFRYIFGAFLGSIITTSILFHVLNKSQKIISSILIIVVGSILYTYDSIKQPFEERKIVQNHFESFGKTDLPVVFGHYLDYLIHYHYSDSSERKQLVYLIDYSKNFDYPSISGDVSLYKLLELKNDLNIQDYNTFLSNESLFFFYGSQSFSYDYDKLLNQYKNENYIIDNIELKKIQTTNKIE